MPYVWGISMVEYTDKAQFLTDALKDNAKKIKLVKDGEEIDRLTAREANPLYARAKILREQIRSALLSQAEMEKATDKNVNKFIKTEGSIENTRRVEEFRRIMTAIGADPTDISTEKLRTGR
jgi:hypothetical protein